MKRLLFALLIVVPVYNFAVNTASLEQIDGCGYTAVNKPDSIPGKTFIKVVPNGIEVTCAADDNMFGYLEFNNGVGGLFNKEQQSNTFALNCVDNVYQYYSPDISLPILNVTSFSCQQIPNPSIIKGLKINGLINGCKYTYINKPFSITKELSINAIPAGIEVTCTAEDGMFTFVEFNNGAGGPFNGEQQSNTFALNCVDNVYQYSPDPSLPTLNVTSFSCTQAQQKSSKTCLSEMIKMEVLEGNVRPLVSPASNGSLQISCRARKIGQVVQVKFNNSVTEPAQGSTNSITLDLECNDGVYQYKNPITGLVLIVTSAECVQIDSTTMLN